jgi:hypothetical protein
MRAYHVGKTSTPGRMIFVISHLFGVANRTVCSPARLLRLDEG